MNLGDRLGWVRFVKRYQTNSVRRDDADYEDRLTGRMVKAKINPAARGLRYQRSRSSASSIAPKSLRQARPARLYGRRIRAELGAFCEEVAAAQHATFPHVRISFGVQLVRDKGRSTQIGFK
jgi:hypothetical protein